MISCLVENENRVLPGMRKKGVATRSRYMCAYIHLIEGYCPGGARGVLPLLKIYVNIYIYLISILINDSPFSSFIFP
jgi:hypothetical protein